MGKVYDAITDEIADWMGRQHVFFVATAPLEADGHVNVSPKGLDTLRVLDEHTVGYLDLTGSGIETIAHLRQNARITLMWCAFEGPPRIVRVHGRGEIVAVDDERVGGRFASRRGERAVILVHAERVSDSCGFSVPKLAFVEDRTRLTDWADHRTDDELDAYRGANNTASIDGLPGYPGAVEAAR